MSKPVVDISWEEVGVLARKVAVKIRTKQEAGTLPHSIRIFGVPRGGIHAAQAVIAEHAALSTRFRLMLVDESYCSDLIVDDIIDSGATKKKYEEQGSRERYLPFLALIDTNEDPGFSKDKWYSFPWERMKNESGPEDAVIRLLEFAGEDPNRDGLKETPARVIKAYGEMFSGYKADISKLFKVFDGEKYDEMVVLRDVDFTSMCEHHMLPFYGTATVAYLPNNEGKIIGVSKLARLVDAFARRFQVQERLTQQITASLDFYLQPHGSACVIKAKHMCMGCRGIRKDRASMITSSLTGVFREGTVRQEFLALAGVR